jgi:GntP family gluconate:H+ symporter
MNDSGFWVVSQMSGMTESEGLRTLTPLTAIMGLVGLVCTMVLAALFPLA